MIGNILFTPADTPHNLPDNVKLKAETAGDANNLLRQYIAYASERAARHLNDEILPIISSSSAASLCALPVLRLL